MFGRGDRLGIERPTTRSSARKRNAQFGAWRLGGPAPARRSGRRRI